MAEKSRAPTKSDLAKARKLTRAWIRYVFKNPAKIGVETHNDLDYKIAQALADERDGKHRCDYDKCPHKK